MNNLKGLRYKKRVSLTDIANATGIALSTLSRIESGDRNFTIAQRIQLCEYFGCDEDTLLGLKEVEVDNTIIKYVETSIFKKVVSLLMDMNDAELNEISQYAEFVKSKRKPNNIDKI